MSGRRKSWVAAGTRTFLVEFAEYLRCCGIDAGPKQGETILQQVQRLTATYSDEHTAFKAWGKMK